MAMAASMFMQLLGITDLTVEGEVAQRVGSMSSDSSSPVLPDRGEGSDSGRLGQVS